MTSRRRLRVGPGFRLAWAIVRQDPVAWLIALGLWLVFHGAPVVTGWALGQVLDSITDGADASATWTAIALLAGLEVTRWTVFLAAVVQWHGGWVAWHTRPRLALLDSLVSDPGPATGRLPGSSGEAVSRFRDDTEDVALVADVWLDVTAVAASSLVAVVILATIDVRVAITVALPALVVMVITHSMGPALRRWRRAAREATAEVTGFVGDVFGAIGAVKALGAERAVLSRFDDLGHDRAREGRPRRGGDPAARLLVALDRRHRPRRRARRRRTDRRGRRHVGRRPRRDRGVLDPAGRSPPVHGPPRRLPPPGRRVGRAPRPPSPAGAPIARCGGRPGRPPPPGPATPSGRRRHRSGPRPRRPGPAAPRPGRRRLAPPRPRRLAAAGPRRDRPDGGPLRDRGPALGRPGGAARLGRRRDRSGRRGQVEPAARRPRPRPLDRGRSGGTARTPG